MSDNTAVFPYQSPPLGNSVSWVSYIRKMMSEILMV